ncbi:MAG TPA: hypothetical protein VIE65_06155 [Methylobacter sp.]
MTLADGFHKIVAPVFARVFAGGVGEGGVCGAGAANLAIDNLSRFLPIAALHLIR